MTEKVELDRMTLASIGGGAAEEKFQQELQNVIANIMDPNTDYDAKRRLVLTFTFISSENRDMAAVLVECGSKLAAQRGSSITAFLGVDRETGEMVAVEHDPGQMVIGQDREEEEEQSGPRPVDIRKGDAK